MITYKLTLKCSRCGCEITIENEKPKWRRDNKVIETLNKARKFVLENPIVTKDNPFEPFDVPDAVGITTMRPALVFRASTFVQYTEFHFIDCPACNTGRAYLGSGLRLE